MGTRVSGGQAVVRALVAHGVDTIFGIPGVHTLALYDALVDAPIRHVLGRHEQGVGFMADGYARASGRPGVASVITGPGVTNIATAVGEAYTDSSPVLVIASGEDQRWAGQMRGNIHDIRDQTAVIRPLVNWAGRATEVSKIPGLIDDAFGRMASHRPRPAYLEIPRDVLSAEAAADSPMPTPACRPDPASEAIAAAVRTIAGAKRIVVYAGGGAVSSGANRELTALVDRLGAVALTSQMGKGSVPEDHPRSLGNLSPTDPAIATLLRQADLALVVGSKLGASETERGEMVLPATMIQIDIDPEEMGRNYKPSQAIVGDARATARALVDGLAAAAITKHGWSEAEIAAAREAALGRAFGAEHADYLAALRRAIPRDGILVNDATMMSYAAARRYPVYEPRTFFVPAGYLTLGASMPMALGAKVARPEATVVAIVGDGGFQFTMQELATAVQFRLGVPIVIFNDSTYTAVKWEQAHEYDRRYLGVDLVNPDFIALAGAYGIPGVRANSPAELERAVVEAAGRDGPTIIDTPIRFDY
ncbi:MAG: thiamine pyrophosphate-binding protein [Chloroflexota bacterium]|nr:thiamine pyrophosphate-binding protein [Chloroflexota bacterium]